MQYHPCKLMKIKNKWNWLLLRKRDSKTWCLFEFAAHLVFYKMICKNTEDIFIWLNNTLSNSTVVKGQCDCIINQVNYNLNWNKSMSCLFLFFQERKHICLLLSYHLIFLKLYWNKFIELRIYKIQFSYFIEGTKRFD